MIRMRTVSVLAISLLFVGGAHAAERPNVLIILADDLGYSDLGCYGGEIATPHIDALAKNGVRFTQLYNSARCCPSRASLMTGLYPTQAGIGDFTTGKPDKNRGPGYLGRLRENCVTIAEVLKEAGYGTYYVGKWHLNQETGPIERGFDEFYGYTRGHSHDQYDADYYIRLPEGRAKEIDPPQGDYYATDVFNDYALEFLNQAQEKDEPWFLFLGHSSPHFPVQAPAERADKYMETYLRGWDVLREERFARMRELGLIDGDHWEFTPRSVVPLDRGDIANGFSGEQNPAWDSLDEDRRLDLARRMSVFAAMVETVDQGIGRIVEQLDRSGELDNTLLLFLSDNGACYEWGPFGFDGTSRRGTTTLRTGADLREIGGRGTHQSYGSAWANLGNTPFRLYKHFTHEGGISTPFIAHWPKGIKDSDRWVRDPAHVKDVMATVIEATGAVYPTQHHGVEITPLEGDSLMPAMNGQALQERTLGFDHQGARALRQGDWKLVWGKRMPYEIKWELYNLAEDRCEMHDLADKDPERVKKMAAAWEAWADRVEVVSKGWLTGQQSPTEADSLAKGFKPQATPNIANKNIEITAVVNSPTPNGVVVAQGGNRNGYALSFNSGKPEFAVRVDGRLRLVRIEQELSGRIELKASLTSEIMRISAGGHGVVTVGPGLIPVQPQDKISFGKDDRTAAGDYTAPNPFRGTVESFRVMAYSPK